MLLSVSVWSGAEAATRDLFHWISATIALPSRRLCRASRSSVRRWRRCRAGRLNMDVPISLGVLLAAGSSLFETIAVGRARLFRRRRDAAVLPADRPLPRPPDPRARPLGGARTGRARSAACATVVEDGAASGRRADRRSAPGHAGPGRRRANGCPPTAIVEGGSSEVDRSLLTGESLPAVRRARPALAGQCQPDRAADAAGDGAGRDSLLHRMADLMEVAEPGAAATCALADRDRASTRRGCIPARRVSWAGLDALRGRLRQALTIAVAVLIITCPCALGLAVPAVQVGGVGAAVPARHPAQGRHGAGTAGRGRHRGLRQDRHADAGCAAGDEPCRPPAP